MKLKLNHFYYFPGGDDEPIAPEPDDASKEGKEGEAPKEKGFFRKIKDALQDWSNQDQQDQEFDDTRV